MENHPVSKIGLIIFGFCFIGSITARAENCVEGTQGLKLNSTIQSQVSRFGGIHAITGKWKLKGILGTFAKTNVEFSVKDGSFWVAINRDAMKQVWLCEGDNQEVLKVKVLKPKFEKNGTILLKPSTGDQVQIAASSSGWRFMKFKKVESEKLVPHSPAKSKSAGFIASEL